MYACLRCRKIQLEDDGQTVTFENKEGEKLYQGEYLCPDCTIAVLSHIMDSMQMGEEDDQARRAHDEKAIKRAIAYFEEHAHGGEKGDSKAPW